MSVFIKHTSAYPLLLPRQNSRSIDDTDALQDGVRHLGTHEPAKNKNERGDSAGNRGGT